MLVGLKALTSFEIDINGEKFRKTSSKGGVLSFETSKVGGLDISVGGGQIPTISPTLSATPTSFTIPGDLDFDGDVDIFDYNILVRNFGNRTVTPTPNLERQACEADPYGTWRTFPDSCADYCWSDLTMGPRACLMVLSESCDCGLDKCWTGKECI